MKRRQDEDMMRQQDLIEKQKQARYEIKMTNMVGLNYKLPF